MKVKKSFDVKTLSSLVAELFDACGVEQLLIRKQDGEFSLTIPETVYNWQIKIISELLMQKYQFLQFEFEPNEGLLIYEDEAKNE